ncbi:MAG: Lrp/AsnC family transcriptional regulator [Methanomicrobiales archaeon]|nr:Lrp/AsnC family transcriptional regulator [Methanomicrobiales archaeon]
MIDRTEQAVLHALQQGIPLVEDPYGEMAKTIGIERDKLLSCIQSLLDRGIIRRFAARINQRELGIQVNAMVAWKVPPERVEEIGRIMATHPEVTHCYERAIVPQRWEYNLYIVLHGYDPNTVEQYIDELASATGISEKVVLFSTEEYKRAPAGRVGEVIDS